MNQKYLDLINISENSALAIVVSTWGSAPRPAGSMMAVSEKMEHVGSVSGGCVEADVLYKSVHVIKDGAPTLVKYSVSDSQAFDVGLACGGEIEIFICKIDLTSKKNLSDYLKLHVSIHYSIDLRKKIIKWGKTDDHESNSKRKSIKGSDYYFGVLSPAPNIIMIGGGEISVELGKLATLIGYRITLIEPRKVFGSKERHPDATVIISKWPDVALKDIVIDNNTALIALSHDPKIDDPALLLALNTDMFYIGALGSFRTHTKRLERFKPQLSNVRALARIKSPAGVKIHAKTAQEIAISILAEIIHSKNK